MQYFAYVRDGMVASIVSIDDSTKIEDYYHADFVACLKKVTPEVKEGWLERDNSFEAPQIVEPPIDDLKAKLKARVDALAEAERKRYITPGEGQAMTYQRKVEEAKRAILEEEPTAADYPMLAASLGVDGETVKEVAAIVLAMDAGWAVIGSAIEKIRLIAKKAIDEAASVEAANAIVETIIWPEGAAA